MCLIKKYKISIAKCKKKSNGKMKEMKMMKTYEYNRLGSSVIENSIHRVSCVRISNIWRGDIGSSRFNYQLGQCTVHKWYIFRVEPFKNYLSTVLISTKYVIFVFENSHRIRTSGSHSVVRFVFSRRGNCFLCYQFLSHTLCDIFKWQLIFKWSGSRYIITRKFKK